MFSCLQILEAFLWFVLITLLHVTLIILTLSVSRLLNLLLRLVAFLLFLNPQCLASISRWIARVASIMENTNLSKQQQVSEIMRQMLTQAQTAGQYFTNDQIKEMTRKVSAEVDLVHQQ